MLLLITCGTFYWLSFLLSSVVITSLYLPLILSPFWGLMPSLTSMSLGMSNQISTTFSNAVNSTTTSLQITIPCNYVDRHTVNIRPLTALRAISSLTLCIYFVRQICYFIKASSHFTPFSNNLSIPFLSLPYSELSNRFLSYLFLFYFIFKLYYIVLVLPNIKMNPPQVYLWSYLKYRSNFSHWPTWSSMIWSLPKSDFISLCSLPCFHTLDWLAVFLTHQDKKFTPISESFVISFSSSWVIL